ncbi:DUF5753 domain-containing protein [Streptomyces achromogenes]|uniref:DUF5753 domain-containing protein n=1 Tax=Streptomyces achromogenes TaxID=67255 RepID=A0ABZ1KVZ9_STRAH
MAARGNQHYTPQERRRTYGEHAPGNLARRGRWDRWVDVADDATARYAAVTRAASVIVQYTAARLPPGYRTAAYRAAITDPGLCPDPDEATEPPAWLAHVPRNPEQRRTLLLDDTVLYRPVGGPATMAEQCGHLLHLMEGTTGAGPVDIRVLPHDGPPGAFQLAGGEVGMVTVYDKQMIIGMHITPWYETRSGYARALTESLLQAVAETADRQHSYDLISQAADRWRRAA